jgi:integrase/recombinase XerD
VSVPELFLSTRAQSLTRSGVRHILNKHVPTAQKKCPSLKAKRVSPRVLRHTCALNTLRATGDIHKVALWFGHESVQTTEAYLRVDPSEKHQMLDEVVPPTLKRGPFRPADKLIASLRGK